MITSFVRTVILYVLVSIAMRIMGKRTIGEMHPTDLVVSIMISDLATVAMESESTPLSSGIVPIFTLVIMELFFAYLILKFPLIRRILVGRACKIVEDGKIIEKNLKTLKVGVEDMEEQIRLAGITDITSVSEVIVEINGQVSIIPREEGRVVPYIVIADGKIRKKAMKKAEITPDMMLESFKQMGINSEKEVLYMSGANGKIIHIQKKEKIK